MVTFYLELIISGSDKAFEEFYQSLPRRSLQEHDFTFKMQHYIPVSVKEFSILNPHRKEMRRLWGTQSDIVISSIGINDWERESTLEILGHTRERPPIKFLQQFARMYKDLRIEMRFLSFEERSAGMLSLFNGVPLMYTHTEERMYFNKMKQRLDLD